MWVKGGDMKKVHESDEILEDSIEEHICRELWEAGLLDPIVIVSKERFGKNNFHNLEAYNPKKKTKCDFGTITFLVK